MIREENINSSSSMQNREEVSKSIEDFSSLIEFISKKPEICDVDIIQEDIPIFNKEQTENLKKLSKLPEIRAKLTKFVNSKEFAVGSLTFHLISSSGLISGGKLLKSGTDEALKSIGKTLSTIGSATEGLQLFGDFAILINSFLHQSVHLDEETSKILIESEKKWSKKGSKVGNMSLEGLSIASNFFEKIPPYVPLIGGIIGAGLKTYYLTAGKLDDEKSETIYSEIKNESLKFIEGFGRTFAKLEHENVVEISEELKANLKDKGFFTDMIIDSLSLDYPACAVSLREYARKDLIKENKQLEGKLLEQQETFTNEIERLSEEVIKLKNRGPKINLESSRTKIGK